MTARSNQPNTESSAFFKLLEDHQLEVRRVLTSAANSPWSLGEHDGAIAGLADAESEIALEIGQRLLRSVSIQTLQSILLHVGAFETKDTASTDEDPSPDDASSGTDVLHSADRDADSIESIKQSREDSGNQQVEPASASGTIDSGSDGRPLRTEAVACDALEPSRLQSEPAATVENECADSTSDEPDDETLIANDVGVSHKNSAPTLSPEELASRLEQLQAHLRGDGEPNEEVPSFTDLIRARDRRLRKAVMAAGLSSEAPSGTTDITRERDKLRKLFGTDLLDDLAEVPSDVNLAFTGWLITRLRSFRATVANDPLWASAYDECRAWIHSLTDHSRVTKPGHIEAFQSTSTPASISWFEDARVWEAKVTDLINVDCAVETQGPNQSNLIRRLINESRRTRPHESEIRRMLKSYLDAGYDPAHPRFLNAVLAVSHLLDENSKSSVDIVLLREIRRHQRAIDQKEELESCKFALPEDWSGFALTRGKRILMLGGTPRRDQEERLREAFQCDSFEWMEITTGNRNATSAVEKLKNGTVDVVIVQLQFVAHAVSKPVFAERSESRRVVGAWTYGLTGLAHTLEAHVPENSLASA